MEEKSNVLKIFSISLRMGRIEAGPPLSTILGNLGVNTVKFCKELNDFTKELAFYYLLEIHIVIFTDKTYEFFIHEPTVSLLLRLVSVKTEIKILGSGGTKSKIVDAVHIKDIFLISYFKFGNYSHDSLTTIFGSISSLNLYVIE